MLPEINFPIQFLCKDLVANIFSQCPLKDCIHLTQTCTTFNEMGKPSIAGFINARKISVRTLLKTRTLTELIHYIGSGQLQRLSLSIRVLDADLSLIIQKFRFLKVLELSNSPITTFEPLFHLEILSLISCHRITNLDSLTELKKLKVLRVNSCRLLSLPTLPQLEKLEISCIKIEAIPDLIPCIHLRELTIRSCHRIKAPPFIGHMSTLKIIRFSRNISIPDDEAKEWFRITSELNPQCKILFSRK